MSKVTRLIKSSPAEYGRHKYRTVALLFVFFLLVSQLLPLVIPPVYAASTLTNEITSFWKLDEASGTRADSVGSNNLNDNRTVTQAGGKLGDAAQFTMANSEYLSIPDNPSLSVGGTDFTISAWVYLDTKSTNMVFVGKYGGAGEYALYYALSTDTFRCSTFPQLDAIVTPPGGVQTGQWYFLTCSHNATTHTNTITVNNTYTHTSSSGSEPTDTTAEFSIGRFQPSGSTMYLNGRVDSVGFWKRILTSDEITELYNSGTGLDYPFSTLSVGTVSLTNRTTSSIDLSSTEATGGTGPYTYQWYRSTSSGFTPGAGNILAGQTSLALSDTELSAGTTYYYVLRAIDSLSTTADSNEFSTATLSAPATSFIFTGPSSGTVDTASGNFTVTPNGAYTGTITPATTGSGTFTPTSLSWSNASDAKTFIYTPASTSGSPHTISVSASPSLTNSSGDISYTVNAQTTYYHILSTGQSLATVYYATPALSTTQPYNNLMLSPGVEGISTPLIPLTESGQGEGGNVETISSGMANSIHAYGNLSSPIVVGLHAHSGTAYSGLKKGTSWYNKGMTQASVTKTYVEDTLGGVYRPLAVTSIHGESDFSGGLASNYESYLIEWQSDYENDLNALTGRSDTIPLLINQMNSGPTGELADAQLNAHINNPGKVILVGPKYQYHYRSDKLHMDVNTQQKQMGEMFAKVMGKVLFEGETWNPLMPSSILRSGNVIVVNYYIPYGTLAIDTTNVAERPDYGFEFSQTGGNSVSIDSVELIGGNSQVKVTLSDTPTGTDQTLKYAWSCYTSGSWCAQAGDSTAVGGNIRDTDTSISPSSDSTGLPLYDWGVTFNEQVSEDSSAPTLLSTSATATSDGAVLTWTTDEVSSSRINYGLTDSYGSSTTETDVVTRTTSHSQTITGLPSCTTYHYQTQSTDAATNTGTGTDHTFTTSGCTGSSSVVAQATQAITIAAGGSLTLLDGNDHGVTLTVPTGFAGSDANFQAHQLDKTAVVSTTSTPTGYAPAGSYLYELKALSDVSTSLTTFDTPITVRMAYGSSDISGINESTLKIYRWDGSTWNLLSGCAVDTAAKAVTCTTTHFSVFGLFGQTTVSGSVASATDSATSDSRTSGCSVEFPGGTPDLFQIDRVGRSARLYLAPAIQPYNRYIIAYGVDDRTEQFGVQFDQGHTSGVINYTINELDPNTDYSFKVQAANGCATGEWSNVLKVGAVHSAKQSYYRVGGSSVGSANKLLLSAPRISKAVSPLEPTSSPADKNIDKSPKVNPDPSPKSPSRQPTPTEKTGGFWQWFWGLFK